MGQRPPGAAQRVRAWRVSRRVLLLAALAVAPLSVAEAQNFGGLTAAEPGSAGGQMVLQADTLTFDNERQVVTAEGGVQIGYQGSTIQAQRVIYYRQTRRLSAEGGVRVVDASGNITTAATIDLSEDMREGFVRTLRLERTVDRTRFSADSAERRPDEVTVYNRGTYTACEPCREQPDRAPLWQVRAQRIIHAQAEQTIYYEDGFLEFFGIPVAYLPYFWGPDGSVKRQSGFLFPHYTNSSRVGAGFGTSYYWALSPFYDVLLTPTYYTEQGLHMNVLWRHSLPNGSYTLRFSGIQQMNPGDVGTGFAPNSYTDPDPGARSFRGSIQSVGTFQLTDRWRFGWDVTAQTDVRYLRDYGLGGLGITEYVSQVYLQGLGTRSFFDARAYYIQTTSFSRYSNDQQGFMPVALPVDYRTAFADPVLGGEVRFNTNLTTVSRSDGFAYNFVNALNQTQRWLVPGFAGDYTRFSVDVEWRRTFTDVIGQRWTPFFALRADLYGYGARADLYTTQNVGGAYNNGVFPTDHPWAVGARSIVPQLFGEEQTGLRAMPAVGLEYRYPFIATTDGASHVIEPIAQVILRPDETRIGQLPNEDAQSLVFDTSNLFARSRFSGFDRIEGGSRLDYGLRYTFQSQTGFLVSTLFGQSHHLSGLNSFSAATRDLAAAGLNSGLDQLRSDYVAHVSVQPWQYGDVSARVRLAEDTLDIRRLDLSAVGVFGGLTASSSYSFVAAQPDLGLLNDREYVSASVSFALTPQIRLYGSAAYALRNTPSPATVTAVGITPSTAPTTGWVANGLGVSWTLDDCFVFTIDYQNIYQGFGDVEPQRRIFARISLRTLGDVVVGATSDSAGGYSPFFAAQ